MAGFDWKETIRAGFDHGSAHVTLLSTGAGFVRGFDHLNGSASVIELGSTIRQSPTEGPYESAQEQLSFGGFSGEIPRAFLDSLRDAAAAGQDASATAYLDGTVSHIFSIPMTAARIDDKVMLFSAMRAIPEINTYLLTDQGGLTPLRETATGDDPFGMGLSAMRVMEVGGESFLSTASGAADGLTGYRIGSGGTLSRVESYGVDESLPVQAITALAGAVTEGGSWLVAAAAGTSSLTVMRVGDQGRLSVTDHVLDDLQTRFAGISALEVIEAGGRIFVLAAGTDDGLSLFSLLPGGRLLHLDSLADSAVAALDNVSGLSAQVVGF